MATRVGCYVDNKSTRVEYDIDTSNRVTAIRRVGPKPLTVVLSRADGSRTYALASSATSLSISTTTANRIQLTFDAIRNRYSGWVGEVRE